MNENTNEIINLKKRLDLVEARQNSDSRNPALMSGLSEHATGKEGNGSLQSNSHTSDANSVAHEIQDIIRRSKNLIKYGLIETPENNSHQSNLVRIKSVLSALNNIYLNNINVKSLGPKQADRPRPLLIHMHSQEDVIRVLRS